MNDDFLDNSYCYSSLDIVIIISCENTQAGNAAMIGLSSLAQFAYSA